MRALFPKFLHIDTRVCVFYIWKSVLLNIKFWFTFGFFLSALNTLIHFYQVWCNLIVFLIQITHSFCLDFSLPLFSLKSNNFTTLYRFVDCSGRIFSDTWYILSIYNFFFLLISRKFSWITFFSIYFVPSLWFLFEDILLFICWIFSAFNLHFLFVSISFNSLFN